MKVFTKNGKEYGRYDPDTKTLYKHNLKSKHLLWHYGGVPAIDREMYDSIAPINRIECTTKDKKMVIDGAIFDAKKEVINFGYGEQYLVALEYWE